MAIKFQYNKTSLNELNKSLQAREKALPTIKSKEAALRAEVRRAKAQALEADRKLEELLDKMQGLSLVFPELDTSCVRIENIELESVKIAGVVVPKLKDLSFRIEDIYLFSSPEWFVEGIAILKNLAKIAIESEIFRCKMQSLEKARKRTTQKVNLYEKVQIPGYKEAIQKIKRFIEDEENLSKSSQKIVKSRKEKENEV